jgi:DNA-binding transcriptional MerR regulator
MGDPSRPVSTSNAADSPYFYKLGDAARIVGVAPSAIRYWVSEFADFVRPVRTKAGQHVFSRRDVKALGLIRRLLHDDGLSSRETRNRIPGLLDAEDGQNAGDNGIQQGVLALDLVAPRLCEAPAGPSLAELDELQTQVTSLSAEVDKLQRQLAVAETERDKALARADSQTMAVTIQRSESNELRATMAALSLELRELLTDLEMEPREQP